MKALKWLLVTVLACIVILAAATLWLLFGLDPNTFKADIEKLAAEQNVELQISGELDWTLWPEIALKIGETNASAPEQGITRIAWQSAHLSLDKTALFQQQVIFNSISIDQAVVEATSADSASGAILAPAAAGELSNTESEILPFSLAVRRFNLTNSQVILVEDQQQTQVEINQLAIKDLDLSGRVFPVDIDFLLKTNEDIQVGLTGAIELSAQLEQQLFTFNSDNSALHYDKLPELLIQSSGELNLAQDQLTINSLKASNKLISLDTTFTVNDLQQTPNLAGKLTAQSNNITGLAEALAQKPSASAEPSADNDPLPFQQAEFSAEINATAEKASFEKLTFKLDELSTTGKGHFQLLPARDLELILAISALNLDDLPGDNSTTSNSSDNAELLAPLLAPLAVLDGGKGHIELSSPAITSNGVTVNNAHLNLFANQNVINIADISGGVFDGQFQATSRIDMRQATPILSFEKQLSQIDLAKAMEALGQPGDFQGILDMNFSGNSKGKTLDSIQGNTKGKGSFTINQPVMRGFNIEQTICDIAARVNAKYAIQKTWPEQTEFDTINGNFSLADNRLTLDTLNTGVGNIVVNANGEIGIQEQQVNLVANSRLTELQTSTEGCTVSRRLVNQTIPMQCAGSYAEDGEISCRPDQGWVQKFVQGLLLQELQNRLFKREQPETSSEQSDQPLEDITAPQENSITEQQPEAAEEEPRDPKEELKKEAIDALLRGIFKQ